MDRRILRYARGLLVGVGLMPWLLPVARAALPLGPVGDVLDGLFLVMCHRRPERTLELLGVAMPLCSRCAGIFVGFVTAGAIARPHWPLRWVRNAALVAAALMVVAVVLQDAGVLAILHPARVLSGALLGHFMGLAVVTALRCDPR